ncbi:MAG: hypothetical protein ACOX7B_03240 [Christensenellales bacterium]|jgi:hypothetical protein
MTNEQLLTAKELGEAVRMIVQALTEAGILKEHHLLQVPRLLRSWNYYVKHDIPVPARAFIRDGVNEVGDPIVFQAVMETKPTKQHRPDFIKTSFTKIGFGETGKPMWVRPAWYLDAYQPGEVVEHKGQVYTNTEKDNMREPGTEGSGWQKDGALPDITVKKEYPVWVATGIYNTDDEVVQDNRVYKGLKDQNWDKPSKGVLLKPPTWEYLFDL